LNFFNDKIKKVEKENRLRELKKIDKIIGKKIYIDGKQYVDFSSNNYLGLRDDKRVIEVAHFAIDKYGLGSGASRIVSGDADIFYEFEKNIAKFHNKESALIFNSGYDANVGIISAIMTKEDIIFTDKYNHASIYDGMFLSNAKIIRYSHNNITDLEEKLIKYRDSYKKAMVVTDSVFSMDGDKGNLKEIEKLKIKYDFIFMVDEAHGIGIFGENGNGIVNEQQIKSADIIMGTLGKAFGLTGAYVASSQSIIRYLINYSRSFIFSTMLPPAIIASANKTLELIQNEKFRREKIIELSNYLRQELKYKGYNTLESNTQIVPVIFNSDIDAIKISKKLYENNLYVPAIRYPAVPANKPRLRISINFNITKEDIDKIIINL